MRNYIPYLLVTALSLKKALASECYSGTLGFPCCENANTKVSYIDADAEWGVENYNWCVKNPICMSLIYGYACCKNSNTPISYIDFTGDWGLENNKWCSLPYNPYDFELGGMYDIAKEYMSKLKVENPIPSDANVKAEGVTIENRSYYSNITESNRYLNVILPPNYSEEKEYPVLYFLHGVYGDESSMLEEGFGALNVPANLAKEGKAKVMIIVSPNEYALPPGVNLEHAITKEYLAIYDNFINELLNNIMPFIESNYSIAKGRENTAIAGFSMGGRNALYIGYTRPDLFGYVAGFSPAWGVTPIPGNDLFRGLFPSERDFKIKDPNKYTPYVTLICTGTEDSVVEDFPLQYHNILTSNQQEHLWIEVEGADHDENAIIVGVYNFVASLFGILNPQN